MVLFMYTKHITLSTDISFFVPKKSKLDQFFDDFLWYFDDFLWYFFLANLQLFYIFFLYIQKISHKKKKHPRYYFFVFYPKDPYYGAQKIVKNSEKGYHDFWDQTGTWKIAKMQRYFPRKQSKIIIIKICLL